MSGKYDYENVLSAQGWNVCFENIEEGKIEAEHLGEKVCYVRWAPGNGLVYSMIVSLVHSFQDRLGGSVLLSLCGGDGTTYFSYPVNPGHIFHLNFIREKFGKHLDEESVCYYTALINWSLNYSKSVSEYASEVYREARNRWQ